MTAIAHANIGPYPRVLYMNHNQNTMELTKQQWATKRAIADAILQQKKAAYNVMVQDQQGDLAMASETNENEEGLYESGKADQAINHLRATSQVTDSLEEEITILQGIVDHIEPTEEIQLGDIIETNLGNFFVAVAADEIEVAGKKYRGISVKSPLYQALAGKHDGDSVEVNGHQFTLQSSY